MPAIDQPMRKKEEGENLPPSNIMKLKYDVMNGKCLTNNSFYGAKSCDLIMLLPLFCRAV
jgi:hypothetical protein